MCALICLARDFRYPDLVGWRLEPQGRQPEQNCSACAGIDMCASEPITVRYYWQEEDYAAYVEVLTLYNRHNPSSESLMRRSNALLYSYYFLPSILTVLGIAAWTKLANGAWWPYAELSEPEKLRSGISFNLLVSGGFPTPLVVWLIALGATLLTVHLKNRHPNDSQIALQTHFREMLGTENILRISVEGIDFTGPDIRMIMEWRHRRYGAMPVARSSDHILIANRHMVFAIPARAVPGSLGDVYTQLRKLRSTGLARLQNSADSHEPAI